MLAKGLSAPQHSTYFVIFDEGLVLDGIPGVAVNIKSIKLSQIQDTTGVCGGRKGLCEGKHYLTDARRFEVIKVGN